jgi:hypothetical protein
MNSEVKGSDKRRRNLMCTEIKLSLQAKSRCPWPASLGPYL